MQLQHEPHLVLAALAAYIQVGCSREAVLHPAPGSRLVQQVLALGHRLVQLHQTAHIPQLLALAGDAADTLGAAFLKVCPNTWCAYSVEGKPSCKEPNGLEQQYCPLKTLAVFWKALLEIL